MIDLKLLNPENEFFKTYKQNLTDRKADPSVLDGIVSLNEKRKVLIQKAESAKAEQNQASKEIANLKKNKEDASGLIEKMGKFSGQVKGLNKEADQISDELIEILSSIPNKLHESVPAGKDESANIEVKKWGEPKTFNFKVKDHADLGEALDILDFERAGKVTGARFAFLKGAGAQMERALASFMIDLHRNEHGYTEIIPPFMVNSASLFGTGQFPKFKEDVFSIKEFDYYLIPTAEVPVTNLLAGEMLQEKDLPKYFVGYSPCFRSEAGSYGKDTKGLFRQHQFSKVELLKFAHPENSYEELENMVSNAEKVLELLELPYKRMALCSADVGFSAAKCYDLEVWLPGQNQYREISSCSNCEDFQARRANIRFKKDSKSKPEFVHTLNGSGVAIGRTLIAILENYQNEDGSITVPRVLQNYMGGLKIINK